LAVKRAQARHQEKTHSGGNKSALLGAIDEITSKVSEREPLRGKTDSTTMMAGLEKKITIKDRDSIKLIKVGNIAWIDAAGDYMCVHTDENTHILRKTMKELELLLDPKKFIRSHRSTIINKHYVQKFCSQLNGEYYLVMTNGKEIKVSRSYKDKVKQAVI